MIKTDEGVSRRPGVAPGGRGAAQGNKVGGEHPETGDGRAGGGDVQGGGWLGPKAEGIHAAAGVIHSRDG